MSEVLVVEPRAHLAASRVFGTSAQGLMRTWSDLDGALTAAAPMAGSDPIGAQWASSYDAAARAVTTSTEHVVNACFRLAAVLEQSGFNYAAAELASTLGAARDAVDRTRWGEYTAFLPPLPPAGGGSASGPPGWSLVEQVVGRLWPNGHQDRLRAAGRAWTECASCFDAYADEASRADAAILDQHVPERAAALRACDALRAHLRAVASAQSAMSRACMAYAAELDSVHAEVIGELQSLLEWTAGIEAAGAALSFVTFGVAELPTQAAEAARVAAVAARVGAVIDRLGGIVRAASLAITDAGARVSAVSAEVRALLGVRIAYAGVTSVRITSVARTARGVEAAADLRLAGAARAASEMERVAAETRWAEPSTLAKHFSKHGADFGVSTARAYANEAHEFLLRALRDRLPMKIDRSGTLRVFDPASNTFGSYTRQGLTRTFFKPRRPGYWPDQVGIES